MINTKRPNADDYTQVGFIEAKDDQGNYQNIDHIYDSEGNIVFQQGYLNEYDGADDFRIPAIGKPLIDYTIYGNASQDGIPTSGNPIMPQGTGEKTRNLFDSSSITLVPVSTSITRSGTNIGILPQGDYVLSATATVGATPLYRTIKDGDNYTFETIRELPYTFTADGTSEQIIRTSGSNFTSWASAGYNNIMLNLGSTPLPYEPYGYKLDISSGGVNLWDRGVPKYVYAKDYKKYNPDNAIALKAGTYTISSNGKLPIIQVFDANLTQLNVDDTIIFTTGYYKMWDGLAIGPQSNVTRAVTITLPADCILTFAIADNSGTYLMLNIGSTALPYEPYIEPIETNIYLGEVETTRKIRKIDLGTLNWSQTASGNFLANEAISDCRIINNSQTGNAICTHLSEASGNNVANTPYSFCSCLNQQARPFINKTGFENLTNEEFKEAMSGVYMWYVLATEETGIVNEPLMRIGDYADSVDFSQARVQIPTLKRPNTTEIDITTSLPPSEVYAKYRGSKTQKYDLFLAANGDSFEAKNGQSLYIGGNP